MRPGWRCECEASVAEQGEAGQTRDFDDRAPPEFPGL
jgi:hypothetical protein